MTALAVLCCTVFATSCRTCKDSNSHKDVPSVGEVRPSSSLRGRWDVEEILSAEQMQTEEGRQHTDALTAYAQGRFLRERRLSEQQEEVSPFQEEDLFVASLCNMPESAETLKEVLGPRLVAKDFLGALRLLEPIANKYPDSLALSATRIDLLLTLGRVAEARKYLEHHLTLRNGRQSVVISQLADVYLRQGDLDALEALLAQPYPGLLLNKLDLDMALWRRRFEACAKQEQPTSRCKQEIHRVVETLEKTKFETLAEVFYAARLLASAGLSEAMDRFLEPYASRRVGSFSDGTASRKDKKLFLRDCADYHFCRIVAAVNARDETAVKSAIAQACSVKIPLSERCELQDLLFRNGLREIALKTAGEQLLAAPKKTELRQGLVRLYATMNQTDKALQCLEEPGRLDAQGMWLRATILEGAGRNQNAYDTWQAIIGPGNPDEQATNLLRLFEPAECEQFLTLCEKLQRTKMTIAVAKALFEQDDSAHNANLYGYLLADHDVDPAKGLTLIQQALKDTPKEPAYLDSLAWAYYKLKQPQQAFQAILDAISHNGLAMDADGVIAWHAALICEQNGLPALAKYYCILAAQGNSPEANLAQKKLEKN
ncbi:MAG: hypothetical protein IJJ26_05770 [Victivallales bacterium]|nr:hypothetical protein [Victivallales bacterium]